MEYLFYILIIVIILCLVPLNFVLPTLVGVTLGIFLLSTTKEKYINNVSITAPEIDNSDVINEALGKIDIIKKNLGTLDDKLVDDNIVRGKRAERSRVGTVRSTLDTFANIYAEQANVDESVDWVNHNPLLDNDPKFQPFYQK